MISNDLNMHKRALLGQENENSENVYHGKLVVVNSGSIKLVKTSFVLSEIMSIGRNEHNDIVIDDAFVSYEHASINRNKQGYWLTDLNSRNKTYLNNQPIIEGVLLKNGDLIKIGAVTFSFEG